MKKYVLLFEEFNPGKAKAKLAERSAKIQSRMKKRQESIAKAAKAKDSTRADIHKTKLEIDNLDMNRLKLKNKVIDLRVKKEKEKEAKKKA